MIATCNMSSCIVIGPAAYPDPPPPPLNHDCLCSMAWSWQLRFSWPVYKDPLQSILIHCTLWQCRHAVHMLTGNMRQVYAHFSIAVGFFCCELTKAKQNSSKAVTITTCLHQVHNYMETRLLPLTHSLRNTHHFACKGKRWVQESHQCPSELSTVISWKTISRTTRPSMLAGSHAEVNWIHQRNMLMGFPQNKEVSMTYICNKKGLKCVQLMEPGPVPHITAWTGFNYTLHCSHSPIDQFKWEKWLSCKR